MRYIWVGMFYVVLTQSVSAADFMGRWVALTDGEAGYKYEIVFAFNQEGDRFTGYIVGEMSPQVITDGKVSGDEMTFLVLRRDAAGEQGLQYAGRLTSEGLLIKAPTRAGGIPGHSRQWLAKRVSSEPPAPLPPKISLPPAGEVPWNGLAKTPPMGWNSYNKFDWVVTDQIIRENADAMVESGMKAAGYTYVNIDDSWEGKRDSQGNIRSNGKFPDMKSLADYVHSKGLKLGIYSSPGPRTCDRFEGSFGHEEQDAKTFAAWGIDYLKYDWCSAVGVYEDSSRPAVYAKMALALQATGRPIVFSLSEGHPQAGVWGPMAGLNLWRTTGDMRDTWESMSKIGFDQQIGLDRYAGPGHWNDPDMLQIGNGGMTDTEYRTHMSLWSLLAAPLLAGNDLRHMTPGIIEILTNREVIAVDQDPLGKQATRVTKNGDLEIWSRPLADGSHAAGLFNRGADAAKVTARWSDLGLTGSRKVRDLWAHAGRGLFAGEYSVEVPSHGVVLVKLTP